MKKLLGLIALLVIVAGGLILFFFQNGMSPEETKAFVDLGPAPTSPTVNKPLFVIGIVFLVWAALNGAFLNYPVLIQNCNFNSFFYLS